MNNVSITPEQINRYKKCENDLEKLNYYFTNDEKGTAINDESIFMKSYANLQTSFYNAINNNEYETLILLVGFSIQPLVLSTSVIKPKKVYLLFSDETSKNCNIIQSWIEKFFTAKELTAPKFIGSDSWDNNASVYKVDSSDPEDIYKKILKIIQIEKANGKIAIDITGGKKTMVSGAFTAASITNTDAYYVDFENYDGANPVPGTEFLRLQKNPVDNLMTGLKSIFDEIKSQNRITKDALEKSDEFKDVYSLLLKYEIVIDKNEYSQGDFFIHNDFQQE